MPDKVTIYIKVEESTGSPWRPVDALPRGEDVYEILGENPHPDRERWPFSRGDLVKCKPYELTDNDIILVASERAEPGS